MSPLSQAPWASWCIHRGAYCPKTSVLSFRTPLCRLPNLSGGTDIPLWHMGPFTFLLWHTCPFILFLFYFLFFFLFYFIFFYFIYLFFWFIAHLIRVLLSAYKVFKSFYVGKKSKKNTFGLYFLVYGVWWTQFLENGSTWQCSPTSEA